MPQHFLDGCSVIIDPMEMHYSIAETHENNFNDGVSNSILQQHGQGMKTKPSTCRLVPCFKHNMKSFLNREIAIGFSHAVRGQKQ
jgi:hypothetical protein